MSNRALVHLAYDWRGGRERIVRIGDGAPIILFLAPLFEEANRTRHLLIEVMRDLAERGFSCFLPDLPGTLESTAALDEIRWQDWQDVVAALAASIGKRFHIASLRGGALLDGLVEAQGRWRFAPADGSTLFRELIRVRMAADREAGLETSVAATEQVALNGHFDVAGYRFAPSFLDMMRAQSPVAKEGPLRTIRLDTDGQPADAKCAGQALWRRSQPEHDPALSEWIADDLARWIRSCASG